jgi:hypothetical protein
MLLLQLFLLAAEIAKNSGEDKAHFKANALNKAGQVGDGVGLRNRGRQPGHAASGLKGFHGQESRG